MNVMWHDPQIYTIGCLITGIFAVYFGVRCATWVSKRAHSPMCVMEYDLYRALAFTGIVAILVSTTNLIDRTLLWDAPSQGMSSAWLAGSVFFLHIRWKEIVRGDHPLICKARQNGMGESRIVRNETCPHREHCDLMDVCPLAQPLFSPTAHTHSLEGR